MHPLPSLPAHFQERAVTAKSTLLHMQVHCFGRTKLVMQALDMARKARCFSGDGWSRLTLHHEQSSLLILSTPGVTVLSVLALLMCRLHLYPIPMRRVAGYLFPFRLLLSRTDHFAAHCTHTHGHVCASAQVLLMLHALCCKSVMSLSVRLPCDQGCSCGEGRG